MKPVARRWAGGPTPLAAFVKDLVSPSLARRGLGEASLLTHWAEIVGAQIAGFARPIELQWQARAAKRNPDAPAPPATLVLRIESAFALEAQHAAAVIVERVNAHLGWRCIDKVAFRQGPLGASEKRRARPAAPSAKARAEAGTLAAPIEAEDLREALTRLGARVIDKSGGAG